MKKKPIMFIGVGQCGGNIVDEAEARGFTSIALNSYHGDLESLKNVTNKIHFKGYNGAGKNRFTGQGALRDNMEEVIEKIYTIANDADIKVLTVAFSTDGGTGSGSGPLLIDILSEVLPDKIINAISVLPTLNESLGSLANSVECVSELSTNEKLGACFFIDNHKVQQKFNFSRKEVYQLTNRTIIEQLDSIYHASNQKSSEGNFDGADLLSVLSTRGTAIIGETFLTPNGSLVKLLKDSWDSESIYTSPEYNQKIVNAGFIYRASHDTVKRINKNELFDQVGLPIEIYEGFYETQKGAQTVATILSGLAFPVSRLSQMEQMVEDNKTRIEDNFRFSASQRYEGKTSWMTNLRNGNKKSNEQNVSISDKLKKFK